MRNEFGFNCALRITHYALRIKKALTINKLHVKIRAQSIILVSSGGRDIEWPMKSKLGKTNP